jgi:Bacterial alpha-L-rhamnosidase 6 hairpin glycosidase domain
MSISRFIFSTCLSAAFLNSVAQPPKNRSIADFFANAEGILGKTAYLASPYSTAGDRLYMIGYQDGSFPPIGWHLPGEMGGIWHHPIKLMDGFEAALNINHQSITLKSADSFENFAIGNRLHYAAIGGALNINRYQFVPDAKAAIYIEYSFTNTTNKPQSFQFKLKAIANLRPVWLGDSTGMIDGKDQTKIDSIDDFSISKDSLNSWFVVFGSAEKGKIFVDDQAPNPKTNTSVIGAFYDLTIPAKKTISLHFVIAGSTSSSNEAVNNFKAVNRNILQLVAAKKIRLQAIDNLSKITLSDKALEKCFRWIKYNTDWLVNDVDGIGRGITAGLPDYPWWFGADMAYSLKGLLATGRHELVFNSIDLLQKISAKTNGNGRIVHETSTNGAVFNKGNVNETAQFVSLVWDTYCFTGNHQFLHKYYPVVEKSLQWLLKENDRDGNLLPDGFGMMEIHGLNSEMIDVASYTQKAFQDAAAMADIMQKKPQALLYKRNAEAIAAKINKEFWVPEFNSYADFIGTREEALHLLDDAIVRADTLEKPWSVAELQAIKKTVSAYPSGEKRGFVLHHNWVVNTPMEVALADEDKARRALATAKKYSNSFGMFVTGIDRNEYDTIQTESFAADTKNKVFSYTGAVMTLPTGVQVVAENNYGHPNEAYALMQKMLRTFSYALPGSIYEVSPDYGMMTQAWNIYAFGVPLVQQFFGIKPLAFKREIQLCPQLPDALQSGEINSVLIGNNSFSLSFTHSTTAAKFVIAQKQADYKLVFSQPKSKYKKWLLNGRLVHPTTHGSKEEIIFKGKYNKLELKND